MMTLKKAQAFWETHQCKPLGILRSHLYGVDRYFKLVKDANDIEKGGFSTSTIMYSPMPSAHFITTSC